jgi:hypothetical protein
VEVACHHGSVSTTPLWVPLVVAGIGVAGTLAAGIAGGLMTRRWADKREDKAWVRERAGERERERWAREDETRTFEHRREVFEDFYGALRALARRAMTTAMVSTALRSCPSTGTLMLGQNSTACAFTLTGVLLPLPRLHTTRPSGGTSTRSTTIRTTRSFTSGSSGSTTLSTSCSYSCARPSRYRRAISVCRSRATPTRLRGPLSARTRRYDDAAQTV